MLLNNNKQTKFFTLNTNDKTETTKFNIQTNYNFSQKAKMALVGISNATDSNLNLVFCPTIKNNNYSSLNTPPLIYAGIGYNTQNMINGKQYYEVNGAYLNEIELKTHSSAPQNDFSYSQLDGIDPIIWYKFDGSSTFLNENFNSTYNLTNSGATFDNTSFLRGNGSIKFLASSSQYATMPNGNIDFNAINIKNGISFCLWYKATSSSGLYSRIFEFGTASSPTGTSRAVMINKNALTSGIQFCIFAVGTDGNAGTGTMIEDNTNDYYNNTWYHLIWTISPTGIWNIYINGIKKYDNQQRIIIQPFTIANKAYYFAKSKHTNDGYFDGNIDDFRIYDFILNQDQANTIYNNTRINYPIIKNELLKLANTADNDPNIHTIPIIWYKFDGSSTFLNENLNSTYNLTNNGTTFDNTSFLRGNGCIKFLASSSQYATMPNGDINLNAINATTGISFSLWFKMTTSSGVYSRVFDFGTRTATNTGSRYVFLARAGAANNLYAEIGYNATDGADTAIRVNVDLVNDLFNDNIWRHFAWTISPSGYWNIYINGINKYSGNKSYIIPPFTIASKTYFFGKSLFANDGAFDGNIDDFRIYSKVLDQEEITRIYNGAKTDYTTPIIEPTIGMDLTPNLWCKFDTGALTTNSGSDTITITNDGSAINAGVSVRGNNSVSLNGSTQYLNGTIEGIANNSWSVSAWLYSKTYATETGVVLCFGNESGAYKQIAVGYSLSVSGAYTHTDSNSGGTSAAFLTDINNWVHIVWMYDAITRTRYIYRNGVKLALAGSIANGQPNPNNTLGIGKFRLGAYYYNGYIDDLRVYTGIVLSQAQINDLYQGNTYYNLPTTLNKYNTNPIDTQYQFELKDEEQKTISHY